MSHATSAAPKNGSTLLKLVFLVITIIWVISYARYKYFPEATAKSQTAKIAAENYAATHTPAPQQTPQASTEALVLMYEGWTPCTTFVGWSCKVRTDGDPIRVSTKNYTWEIAGKGETPPPKEFTPDEAKMVSSDKNNPHVKVWVYKKITIAER